MNSGTKGELTMYGNRGYGGSRDGGYGSGSSSGGGSGGYGARPMMTAPVKVGEELDVTIEAVGEKGDGMAKVQGFVLFVPNTKSGDRVKVKVTRVLAKVGFAQVVGQASAAPEKKTEAAPEEDFDPKEELDSENFGEDSEGNSEGDAEEDSEDEEMSEEA